MAPGGAEVVGSFNEDILGGSSTCRCQENDITSLVADAILWGTDYFEANPGLDAPADRVAGL